MKVKETLITAAGGNGTAIRILDKSLSREQYAHDGKQLGEMMEQYGAEQAGFLVLADSHFEMAGGEFCGNASRAAAMMFSKVKDKDDVSFTVSGFTGMVHGKVVKRDDSTYFVSCQFPGMPTDVSEVILDDGEQAHIVDLGGIVHVVIEAPFPAAEETYSTMHREISKSFGLRNRDAVGVIWFQRRQEDIEMHPVVWVRDVDTFFYEQSCGSGTIAVGKVTGSKSIVQPSGKTISAEITENEVVLASEMEVVR